MLQEGTLRFQLFPYKTFSYKTKGCRLAHLHIIGVYPLEASDLGALPDLCKKFWGLTHIHQHVSEVSGSMSFDKCIPPCNLTSRCKTLTSPQEVSSCSLLAHPIMHRHPISWFLYQRLVFPCSRTSSKWNFMVFSLLFMAYFIQCIVFLDWSMLLVSIIPLFFYCW